MVVYRTLKRQRTFGSQHFPNWWKPNGADIPKSPPRCPHSEAAQPALCHQGERSTGHDDDAAGFPKLRALTELRHTNLQFKHPLIPQILEQGSATGSSD